MILKNDSKTYFQTAIILGILVHGVLLFFTFEKTYDAYVHIFFGNHYAENWFDHWEYKWYTGFTLTSYPPLIHYLIALFSFVIGLKGAFVLTAVLSVMVFIRGVYVFSKLWVDEQSAGIAALLAVVAPSYIEAIHIFGQLPSITGIAVLLNTTPYIYQWIRTKQFKHLLLGLSFLAVITTIHHVTTIFGMVFFIFPVIGLAIMDNAIEEKGNIKEVRIWTFIQHLIKIIKPALLLGIGTGIIALVAILPYWLWSRSDPITQVPIPHGSRDNFLEVLSSGLVFFLIPWGMMLFFLPHLFRKALSKRTIILGLSMVGAFFLGTGGTTPYPRMLLGENAFNILTLDRFTFWATIMAIPFWGYFIKNLFSGNLEQYLKSKFGYFAYRLYAAFWLFGILVSSIFIINIHYFKPLQPPSINITPITNFLERDQHDKWRYLTLGFGDQVAWLSANTNALTVDGNYHSARRLPELTTRKVERLENAKYLGTEGIAALHQFLTIPEKYNLKYIFSNDQFYDPVLFFSGWQKLQRLENNIDVWEKPDIPKLPTILPRKDIPRYQQLMWSILPLTFLINLLLLLTIYKFLRKKEDESEAKPIIVIGKNRSIFHFLDISWTTFLFIFILVITGYNYKVNKDQYSPENVLTAFFDALDFKEFTKAFEYYNPDNAPSVEQMLLDLSQEDAITLSYSKLNNLEYQITYNDSKDRARSRVKAEWITSINSYTTYYEFEMSFINNKWWLEFDQRDLRTPPEQLFSTPTLSFKNQGRRNVDSPGTAHEDILDRPEVHINEANLVKMDSNYHVVGSITNIDNDPAYLTVTATLYDSLDREIITYNARDVIVHELLPKESTLLRVDFEDVAHQVSLSNYPKVYNPDSVNPFKFISKPFKFVLSVKTIVTSQDMYKNYGISDLQKRDTIIEANFVNTGTEEINIPRILTGIYGQENLIWVENQFLETAVRPQRSKSFIVNHPEPNNINIIQIGEPDQLLVNFKKSSDFYQKWLKNNHSTNDQFIPLDSAYLVAIFPSGFVAQ